MRIKRLPAGFIIPAQPVMASRPPSGAELGHEIKHNGYRLIVWRDGSIVRLYSRNAIDLTARLSAIAAAGCATSTLHSFCKFKCELAHTCGAKPRGPAELGGRF